MSLKNTKKYFWLKLKDDFFHDPKIKKLRKIAGGDTYTIILQKIMLLSIRDGGVIQFQGIEKSLPEELALILDEDVTNVEIALNFMNSIGLIESLSEKEFLLPSVPTLIGSEGDSAERMRKLRERKSTPKQLPSQCDALVTKSDTEKELEIERYEEEAHTHEVVVSFIIPNELYGLTESQIQRAVEVMGARKKPVDPVKYEKYLYSKIEIGDDHTCQNVRKILSELEFASEAPWDRDKRIKREQGEALQLALLGNGYHSIGEAYTAIQEGGQNDS
jgi:predicted phage replisome organizer